MYKIIMQEERHGKTTEEVVVKHIRYFPIEKKGVLTGFGPMGFLLLQVVLENEAGERLTLKLNASGGAQHPKFLVVYPDTMEYPLLTVGEGRRKMVIVDTLSRKIRVAGKKEEYTEKGFVAVLTGLVSGQDKDTILNGFAARLAHVASQPKKAKKQKKAA